jgi:tRNA G18 (ribose-2'-O)-methylase SpoU
VDAIAVNTLDDSRIAEYRHTADPHAIERAGLFVAEGRWVVERLLARPRYELHSVLVTPTALAALRRAVDPAPLTSTSIFVVDQHVMDQIVGFHIHRGCLALAKRPPARVLDDALLHTATRVLLLEGVNNPDNVGGIFRSASAFDVDLIVLGPACGDPLYRKAIRTSMAATLDVPFVRSGDWPAAIDLVRTSGFQVVALTPAIDALPLRDAVVTSRVALMLGSEGPGLTAAALERADVRVRIETSDRVDSLNVTVAASIAMHHWGKARFA